MPSLPVGGLAVVHVANRNGPVTCCGGLRHHGRHELHR
jgi:hypothetical protein